MLKRIFETALDNMYITNDYFVGINKIELPKGPSVSQRLNMQQKPVNTYDGIFLSRFKISSADFFKDPNCHMLLIPLWPGSTQMILSSSSKYLSISCQSKIL